MVDLKTDLFKFLNEQQEKEKFDQFAFFVEKKYLQDVHFKLLE